MPITRTYNYGPNQDMDGIIWRFQIEDDIEDIRQQIAQIRVAQLIILPHITTEIRPLLPPLDFVFDTGHLIRLDIRGMDVTNLPKIPSSVTELIFNKTSLSRPLTELPVDWTRIEHLCLNRNPNLDGTSIVIPAGPQRVVLEGQSFNIVRLPPAIQSLLTIHTTYHQIVGTLPKKTFGRVGQIRDTDSIYEFDRFSSNLYRQDGYSVEAITHNVHLNVIYYMKRRNDEYNSQVYLDFGSIPRRIQNAYEHRENPIVAALHLSSNYPRRMAEFITEHTCMPRL